MKTWSFQYHDKIELNTRKGQEWVDRRLFQSLTHKIQVPPHLSTLLTLLAFIDNDVSIGSYNYYNVKRSFMNAYRLLTSMIGFGHERNERTERSSNKNNNNTTFKIKPNQSEMVTLLGSILTVDRQVLEQRDLVEAVYELYMDGSIDVDSYDLDGSFVGSPTTSGTHVKVQTKRKRSVSPQLSVVYTDDDASDDEEDHDEDFDDDEEEEDLTEDEDEDGDITSFYQMNTGKINKQEAQMMNQSYGRKKKRLN